MQRSFWPLHRSHAAFGLVVTLVMPLLGAAAMFCFRYWAAGGTMSVGIVIRVWHQMQSAIANGSIWTLNLINNNNYNNNAKCQVRLLARMRRVE
jgi:hypothetical protein